jgi:hypothetical protein
MELDISSPPGVTHTPPETTRVVRAPQREEARPCSK